MQVNDNIIQIILELHFFTLIMRHSNQHNKVQTESQSILMSSQLWVKWYFFKPQGLKWGGMRVLTKLHSKQSIKKKILDFFKAQSANTDVFTYIIDLKGKSISVYCFNSVFFARRQLFI